MIDRLYACFFSFLWLSFIWDCFLATGGGSLQVGPSMIPLPDIHMAVWSVYESRLDLMTECSKKKKKKKNAAEVMGCQEMD